MSRIMIGLETATLALGAKRRGLVAGFRNDALKNKGERYRGKGVGCKGKGVRGKDKI